MLPPSSYGADQVRVVCVRAGFIGKGSLVDRAPDPRTVTWIREALQGVSAPLPFTMVESSREGGPACTDFVNLVIGGRHLTFDPQIGPIDSGWSHTLWTSYEMGQFPYVRVQNTPLAWPPPGLAYKASDFSSDFVSYMRQVRAALEKEAERKAIWRRSQLARAKKFGLRLQDTDLRQVPSFHADQFFLMGNPSQYKGVPVIVSGLWADRGLSRREMVFKLAEGRDAVGFVPDDLLIWVYRSYTLLIVLAGMAPYPTGAGGGTSIPTFYILGEAGGENM